MLEGLLSGALFVFVAKDSVRGTNMEDTLAVLNLTKKAMEAFRGKIEFLAICTVSLSAFSSSSGHAHVETTWLLQLKVSYFLSRMISSTALRGLERTGKS